jgi:uncharacterized membrane protein YuzA (DUF378 family)
VSTTALVLAIIGALNWLFIGLFQYDAIAAAFGGAGAIGGRIVEVIIGLGGLYCISLLTADKPPRPDRTGRRDQGNGTGP